MNDVISASDKSQGNKDWCDSDMGVGKGVVFLTEVMEGHFDGTSLMQEPTTQS